ncbi:hypothetical protein ZIOFF_073384 [Zingiber officinale]|uniref:Uncharacterized protein n=1 Tax=Zingiber officinale TaxID=94328 RepID=A0A8J5EP85_ZINOF|nr:hypothetical protein ZIOFF_073384 [Zingiber officinale]
MPAADARALIGAEKNQEEEEIGVSAPREEDLGLELSKLNHSHVDEENDDAPYEATPIYDEYDEEGNIIYEDHEESLEVRHSLNATYVEGKRGDGIHYCGNRNDIFTCYIIVPRSVYGSGCG